MTLAKLRQIKCALRQLNEDIGSEQEQWELKKPELQYILFEAETLERRLKIVLSK